jgi:propanol-preferring alcohol dehydrogenase
MDAWAVVEHQAPLQKIKCPIPKPAATEVLIKVTHCGVCHSDLHFWEGFYDLGGGKRFNITDRGVVLPRAIGHEILGTVAALGPDAEGVAVGDRRIVYPWIGCGHCRRCEAGEDNLCAKQRSLGVMQDGGFASHVVVPHSRYLVDHGNVDPAVAATFGCSGITTLSAIRKVMPLAPDDPVVLVGAGGLGLSAIAMLRALGHQVIISVDISADKRAAAIKTGATAAVDGAGDDPAKEVLAAASGPVLAVLDFVNSSTTAQLALGVLAKGGKMVQVGVMGGELNLSLVGLIFKAVTIMGNNTGNPAHLREVASMAREGKLAPIPVTTLPWDGANTALMRLRDGQVTGRLVLTTI